jgi:hypothetical protein
MKYSIDAMCDAIRKMYYPNEEPLKEFLCSIIDGSLAVNELPPFLENITQIWPYTFAYCHNLALTSLPEHITEIDSYAFTGCSSLALTFLPESITRIESFSFQNCSNLALTSIPKNVDIIGSCAF